jgi:hypothetical protein
MSCKINWSNEYIDNILSNNFRTGELRKHREDILLDREKSMMPATIPYVEIEKTIRKNNSKIYDLTVEKQKLKIELNKITTEISNINVINYDLRNSKIENKEFIRACPGENCNGFLSIEWNCSLCDITVCNNCLSIKSDDHICKENDIKTALLLSKDTKGCPNCASMIFKIDGCNLMFCTKCHISFDWNTSKIQTVNLHNPHYFEWLRERGKEIPRTPDNPCLQLHMPIYWTFETHLKTNNIKMDNIGGYLRIYHYIKDYEIEKYPVLDIEELNRNLRIKYLLNEMTEDAFKRKLQIREKMQNKNKEFRQVMETGCDILSDLLMEVFKITDQKGINKLDTKFEELRDYFNTILKELFDKYNYTKIIMIDTEWTIVKI